MRAGAKRLEKAHQGRVADWRTSRRLWGAAAAGGALVVVTMFASLAVAAPMAQVAPTTSLVKATCPIAPSLSISMAPPPSIDHPSQVLNINWKVVNDEDSGNVGYWALDYVTVTAKAWFLAAGPHAGSFWVTKTYKGVFVSAQGALSPTAGTTESESATGTLAGGYNANITNMSFVPGVQPTSGSLGTKDYGGTLTDVLLGSYGNGQVGDTSAFDFVAAYFSPTGGTTEGQDFAISNFGFVYGLNSHLQSPGSSNTWCDFGASTTTGDIVTTF